MKFFILILSLLLVFNTSAFAQFEDDDLDLESDIEQELSTTTKPDKNLEDDIANSLEDDEFSDNGIEDDIANSLEDDESNAQLPTNNTKQKNYTYTGKITPYEKKERYIDHPLASKGLYKITKDLDYLYKINQSEQKNHASVRFGVFNPTNLQTENGAFFFSDLYDDPSAPMLLFDWEWQLKFLGRLSFKLGSGLYYVRGNGRFNSSLARAGDKPLEDFSLFTFPNSANLVYKLQFWNNQVLIPYVDAGLDGFTLMEFQEGESVPKLGASLGAHFSLGLAFNISFLDRWSIIELDRDYGINSVYLVGEFRNYLHITGPYDFSGSFVSGGLAFDF